MARKRRGRGEGSIFQREDGLWVGSLSLGCDGNGKRKRRTVYGATKLAVQQELRKLQDRADSGRLADPSGLTLSQFLAHWLEDIKPAIAANTFRGYKRSSDHHLTPQIGGVRLTQLAPLHVQAMYSSLAAAGVSADGQKRAGVALGVALQHAVDLHLVPHNVARDVRKPRHQPKEMQALDPRQVQAFLAEARADRLFALYVFLLDSGAREGEAFALQWPDLDWERGAVGIVRSLEEIDGNLALKENKTKKSRRRVALSSFTMEALAEHRKALLAEGSYRPDGPVFCDSAGGWLRKSNVLRRSFRPILKRAGLPPVRPYDLRHSSATLLLLAGEDSKVVAERLGHSTTMLTQNTYQHVLPGMQERAARKLDALLRQTTPAQQAVS
jgi:integrase